MSAPISPIVRFALPVAAGMLGLAALLLFSVILYIVTDYGTVKITGIDASMKVQIDEQEIRIENLGQPVKFRAGEHTLLVTRDGLEVKADTFLIRRGVEKVLEVTYTPKAPPVAENKPAPPAPVAPPVDPKPSVKVATPAPPAPDPEYITTRTGQIKLKRIPAGTFLMGSPEDEKDADTDEKPQHRVRITRPFYLGVYEVTQSQYEAVMGSNPSWFSANGGGKDKVAGQSTDRHPVENISWLDAVKFCNTLSEMEGLTAFYVLDGETVRVPDWNRPGYRLPTEAEWEYACRADAQTVTRYSFGDDGASLGEYAWCTENSGSKTHPVGEKRRNGFDLYDMHGNVWEWCWDGFDAGYYKQASEDDPRGLDGASYRVYRGGGWLPDPRSARSAYRGRLVPGLRHSLLGFRVALVQSSR